MRVPVTRGHDRHRRDRGASFTRSPNHGKRPIHELCWLLSRALCRRYDDVAIVHRTVIALKQQRPGIRFNAVDRAAGNSRNLPVADDAGAVEIVGEHPSDERDIHRLPLPGRPGDVLAWRDDSSELDEMM